MVGLAKALDSNHPPETIRFLPTSKSGNGGGFINSAGLKWALAGSCAIAAIVAQGAMTFGPGAIGAAQIAAAAFLISAGALAALLAGSEARKAGAAERLRLHGLVDLAAIMVRDTDGVIRFWSDGCMRLYGWTAAEAEGQVSHALLRTVYPGSRASVESILLQTGVWSGEVHQRTRLGSEVVIIASKVVHRGAETLIMETLTDVTPLHQSEDALRISRANLRSVFDTAADCIIVAHEDGRIVSINKAGLRIFGYESEGDLKGRDIGILMPASEAARHGGYVAAHVAGAPPRVIGVQGRELLAVRQDGSAFVIELSVSSFGDIGSRFITGIIRDATERREGETALRDSEARLRLVQQVGEIAAADWTSSGSRAFVSAEYHRLYGLPAGEPAGTYEHWLGRVHPDDRVRVAAETRPLNDAPLAVATQFRIVRPDGAERWIAVRAESFEEPGGGLRVIGGHQDITDLVAAREALAARRDELELEVTQGAKALVDAELQFRSVFDSQFQFVVLLDPKGTILLANRTALAGSELIEADIVGYPFWETDWWPNAEHDRLRAKVAEAATGVPVRREVQAKDAMGRSIWIDLSLKPVLGPASRQVDRIIAEWRDVTEPHELAEKLAQAQKVQALGQLAGGIAHDFNNILQSISGAARLIEQRPADLDRTRRLARASIDAAARGASITQRLLSFARRGSLNAEVIATVELLNSMREVLAHTLGTAISIRVAACAGLPPILADRGQLETALVNLGTNARDAMPNGGILTLSAEAVSPVDAGTRPANLGAGWYVRISVADGGSGMDEATLARVAEPFFTTKPIGSGTGLGLAMVRGFAEQSGGAMTITTDKEIGTTVTMWLKQAMDDSILNRVDETGDRPARSISTRVLIVDDDDLVRETLAAQMEDLGFSTLLASSGSEALALIESGVQLDALVSDLSMPGMSGVVTIQKARALRRGLPCFLLTGYVGERAALDAGNNFTLVHKPISGRKLAARIEAGLEAQSLD